MAQMTTADLLKSFQAEIEKSAVISDHFKSWLQGQMLSMATIAHKTGYNEGMKEERKAQKKRKGKK